MFDSEFGQADMQELSKRLANEYGIERTPEELSHLCLATVDDHENLWRPQSEVFADFMARLRRAE